MLVFTVTFFSCMEGSIGDENIQEYVYQDAASTNDNVNYCLMFNCVVNSVLVKYTSNILEVEF